MDIKIVRKSDLSSESQSELNDLLGLVFAGADGGLVWADSDWNVLLYLEGVLISNVEILERDVLIGRESIRIGGIGGVATHPDYRRRGFASRLMNHARDFMRDELKLPYALLVCGDERLSLYTSLGWQLVTESMYFDQPGGRHKFAGNVMVIELANDPWPPGAIDLCGLPW